LGLPYRFPSCVVPAENIPLPLPRRIYETYLRTRLARNRNIRRGREYKWRRPEPIGDSQHQLARMPREPIKIPAQTLIEVPARGGGGEHTATRGRESPCF
jgi:hypothetical protein